MPSESTTLVPAHVPTSAEVIVVGAGPAGSAAAAWAASAGHDVLLIDSAIFPRDKTCGDGLTPRAMAELELLGLKAWTHGHIINRGLRLSGFGQHQDLAWPSKSLPKFGSAVRRTELDNHLRLVALNCGAGMLENAKVIGVQHNSMGFIDSLTVKIAAREVAISGKTVIVADGVRSPVGKILGRQWHRDTVYGVAARAYLRSPRSDEEWITSDLELRNAAGDLMSGYGWVFPLGHGEVNIGVGTLATARRPASGALRPLLDTYTAQRRSDWSWEGEAREFSSALLPMGGAVSHVAGPNWMLIGDAAGCVNPLNGEGIDYGLETGRLAAEMIGSQDLTAAWPKALHQHYGPAFSI
ncbi:MAG: geranylgeranyl reductase family protein, partial [Mycobacteriaceae bacterium]